MTDTRRRCSICSTGYTPRARERKRDYKLRAKYGITTEQYVDLLAAQGGRCAICRSDTPGGRWHRFMVDHCHETGTVRGLLCHRCNVILGMMGDTANGVEAYVRYFTEAGR